jgi:hypothetical protein
MIDGLTRERRHELWHAFTKPLPKRTTAWSDAHRALAELPGDDAPAARVVRIVSELVVVHAFSVQRDGELVVFGGVAAWPWEEPDPRRHRRFVLLSMEDGSHFMTLGAVERLRQARSDIERSFPILDVVEEESEKAQVACKRCR